MSKDTLDEREFELVNIIGSEIATSQRDLSRHMDISLGMLNMLIRRLIAKGYIRIRQLNKRKVEYILTPKGFSEKMQKSMKYTLKTINSITMIKERLKVILTKPCLEGERNFVIIGKSDLALLVEAVLKELCQGGHHVTFVQEIPLEFDGGIFLVCRESYEGDKTLLNGKSINLIEELAKDQSLNGSKNGKARDD